MLRPASVEVREELDGLLPSPDRHFNFKDPPTFSLRRVFPTIRPRTSRNYIANARKFLKARARRRIARRSRRTNGR